MNPLIAQDPVEVVVHQLVHDVELPGAEARSGLAGCEPRLELDVIERRAGSAPVVVVARQHYALRLARLDEELSRADDRLAAFGIGHDADDARARIRKQRWIDRQRLGKLDLDLELRPDDDPLYVLRRATRIS